MILELFLIGMITVFVIDYLNAPQEMFNSTIKLIYGRNSPIIKLSKPFNCSTCMSFWIGLIWMLIFYKISLLNIFILCVGSFLTPTYYELTVSLKMLLERVFTFINTFITK